MKKATGLITIILGLIISSCDKKNASFVNRRTATHEKIGKTKEAQPAKAKKEERLTVTPLKSEQVSETTKEKEEPKQESTDSVVIQPQHQSPPSVLAPPQTPVVDNVIAVVDDHGSSSVPRLAQSEVLSSQDQVSEPTKDKDPAPIPEPVTNPSSVTKPDSKTELAVKLVDYITPAEPETMPELSLTLEALEANAECWQTYRDLEKLSDKDKAIKAQVEKKRNDEDDKEEDDDEDEEYKLGNFEDFERLLEEMDDEEAERSKMEKQMKESEDHQRDRFIFEFDAMQKAEADKKAKLEAAKEEHRAKLKERGSEKRAKRINLRAEAKKRAYDGSGFEKLFNEDKIVGAEDIKENRERSKAQRQMKEAEELQRDRANKEEQMRSFELAAMQKAEAEQKTRLEERAKIWADYLAECHACTVSYYAKNPIEAQKVADYWYKYEQEKKRRDEEYARRREEEAKWLDEMREKNRKIAWLDRILDAQRRKKEEEERQADIRRNEESRAERESRYRKRDIQTTNKLTN